MSIILFAALAAAAIDAPIAHRVTVQHRDTPVEIVYRADVATRTRQVGIAPAARPSTERCHWTATIVVAREVRVAGRPGTAFDRVLPGERRLSGSRAGNCVAGRKAIAAEMAGKADEIRAHLIAAADGDRPMLLAALDETRRMATD